MFSADVWTHKTRKIGKTDIDILCTTFRVIMKVVSATSLTIIQTTLLNINPYPTAFPYGNGMVLHFYQQQESSTTNTVHKVINKRLKTYV